MTLDELEQWIKFIGYGVRPQAAKQWFNGRKGQFKITKLIRGYLSNKAYAVSLRLKGNIEGALLYEKICEDIYARFPEDLKW